jgi:hypothetical protein
MMSGIPAPDEMVPLGPVWPVTDEVARRIIRRWANRPWEEGIRLILADRLEELGAPFSPTCIRQGYRPGALPRLETAIESRDGPRRARQRALVAWKDWLKRTFGDFDEDNQLSLCEEPADTPAPLETGDIPF